jgi:hydroxymethylbilane synthase
LGDAARFSAVLDAATARNVTVERALQAALGGGCQMAFGAHVAGDKLYFFHEKTGIRTLALADADYAAPAATAARVLQEFSLP